MKTTLLIFLVFVAVSCQSKSSGPAASQEPVPMGSGRVETKAPSEL